MTLFSWFNNSAPALDKAPFYPLAEQVYMGRLSLEEAQRQAIAPRILAQVNADIIDRYDDAIRALALHNLSKALILAELNYEMAKHRGDRSVQGSCKGTLGWLYRERNQLNEALAHYQESCRIFENLPECRFIVAETRRDIGDIYERQEKLSAAREEYEAMREIAIALRRPDLESEALNRQGRLYLTEGQTMDALAAFEKALKLSREHGLMRGQETALGNCGVAYQLLGRLADAERNHREALAISQSNDARNVRDAVAITQSFVDQDHIGRHMGDLGSVLLARGRLDEAEQQLLQAIRIARQTNDRAGEQQWQGILGNVYQARPQHWPEQRHRHGRWLDQAVEHHTQAMELARERGDERSQSVHLLGLGNDYCALERFDEAQRCYEEAFGLADKRKAEDVLWRLEYVRGNLAVARGQYETAYGHYAGAVEQVETQRGQIDIELRKDLWHNRVALYKHAALCCMHLKRSDNLRLALQYTEQSKARYLADRLGQSAGAEDDIQAVLDRLDQDTAVVVFNVTEAETLVFLVTNQPPGSPVVELDEGWQTAEGGRIRARRFDSFDRRALLRLLIETDDAGQVQGGYLVDYYRERRARDQARKERRELTFEEQCWSNGPLKEHTNFIYTAVLAAVDKALASLAIEHVIFMPNLGLALLPLHACCRSNDSAPDYFLDHFTVQYAPSFRMLKHCQQQVPLEMGDGVDLLAVADPTQDLPGTEIEIKLINRIFRTAHKNLIFSGDTVDQATPQNILAAAPNYPFIHFACHGYFNLTDLLRSALRLAANRAASTDQASSLLMLDMILPKLKLPRTRLVVMSACETGMADPGNLADEYFSLPAGFLLAGAPTVVASLWLASDLSTILLMRYFYDQHITYGCPPAAALCCAQIWLRDLTLAAWRDYNAEFRSSAPSEYTLLERERKRLLKRYGNDERAQQICPFAHPYYWAAFTVIGI